MSQWVENEHERANIKGWEVRNYQKNERSFTKWLAPNENTMPGALSTISVTHTDSPNQPALLWMNI